MKKPVLTVKAVSQYNSPNASKKDVDVVKGIDVEQLLNQDEEENKKPLKKRQKVLKFQSNSMMPQSANKTSLYQVFVHNLPAGISTEELARAFRKCGEVSKVEILDYSKPDEGKKKVPKIRQQLTESKM